MTNIYCQRNTSGSTIKWIFERDSVKYQKSENIVVGVIHKHIDLICTGVVDKTKIFISRRWRQVGLSECTTWSILQTVQMTQLKKLDHSKSMKR